MKKLVAAFGCMVLVGVTGAASLAQAEDHAAAKKGALGNAEAGKAKTAVCAACHGADGNSAAATFPKLAGQGAKYIVKQLHDMKSGARSVPQMAGFLPGLSDQDILDIAAYYAAQTTTLGKADPKLVELGRNVYRAGNAASGVTACAACHGATGKGMPLAVFPRLSGQHAGYIEAQLKAFRASGRGDENGPYRDNDGDSRMMRATAAQLSDSEIKALSSYISGLY